MKKLRILIISVFAILAFCMLIACGAPALSKPENLEIRNKTLSWDAVENARGYTVDINGVQHDIRRTSYSFEGTRFEEGTYTFKVKARGNDVDFADSDWATVKYVQGYESGLVYKLTADKKAYVIESVGTAKGNIVIDDTYNDLPVVEIGDFAFFNAIDVKSVVIGKNVTRIGDRAFYGCTEMASIVIPDSVTEIGELAFQSCHSLTEFVIPDKVTTIRSTTFAYCRSLVKVEINENVTEIGDSAFKSCTALESITIPEKVARLGKDAFRGCSKLASVKIEAKSLDVGESVFQSCVELKSVDLGNCEMTIAKSMFADCSKLTDIAIPNLVPAINDAAFANCTALANVSIGAGVTAIGTDAFFNTAVCKNYDGNVIVVDKWIVDTTHSKESPLTSDDVNALYEENIVGIGDQAFRECEALRTIRIPLSVKYIGRAAFYKCTGLIHVVIGDNVVSIEYGAFGYCASLTNIVLGNNVERIGGYAFAYCENLTCAAGTINIPDKVKSIGTSAFYGTALWNNALAALEGNGSNDVSTDFDGVLYVDKWLVSCFPQKSGFTFVANGTVGIADYAFAYCSQISLIRLPNTVKYLGEGAFFLVSGPSSMLGAPPKVSINIPDGITEIKPYTFYATTGLSQINIPESVTKIGHAAFGGSGIESVTIPDSVTEIAPFAFWACQNLTSVKLSENLATISDRAFSVCTSLQEIEIPSRVTSIGERAFFNCSSLKSVKFNGDLVEDIADKAFYMCESLKSISLPDNVTKIGDYAFYKCKKLSSINFNNSLETIGDYAFYGCERLKTVKLPDTLSVIGSSAFRHCAKLKEVKLSRKIMEIGEHAFYGDHRLTLYSETAAVPAGWTARYNSAYRPVVLGCTFDAKREYVVSVEKTDTSMYNVYAVNGITGPKRAGYTFVGWATTPDAVTAEYTANELATAPNGTLYSVWVEGDDPEDKREEEQEEESDKLLEDIIDIIQGTLK